MNTRNLSSVFDVDWVEAKAEVIALTAERLADLMASVHGGRWRYRIDHERQCVLVRRA